VFKQRNGGTRTRYEKAKEKGVKDEDLKEIIPC
jgi:hypothetical protein